MEVHIRRTRVLVVAAGVVLMVVLGLLIRYRDLISSKLDVNLASPDSAAALDLRQIAEVSLPGPATRFDYQSIDERRQRLFIAHLGADQVTVFDLNQQQVITTIQNVAGAYGVLVVPELGQVYASAASSHQVVVIDAQTLKIIARTDGGQYPDGLAYAPEARKVFVSDETGGAEVVIDTATHQTLGRIDLGGDAGNTHYDPVSRQIFVAVHAPPQLVAIDPASDQVTTRLDLPGCQAPHGFYLDPLSRRAFVTCAGNARLMAVNLDSRRITAMATVGDVPDVLAFDTGLGRLYIAAESGVVAVFDTRGQTLTKIGQAFLAPNAHTVAVDAQTHRVYFPLENIAGQPVLRIFEPAHP